MNISRTLLLLPILMITASCSYDKTTSSKNLSVGSDSLLASFYDDGTSVVIYKCKENAVVFTDCVPNDQYISIQSQEFYRIWNASYKTNTPASFEKSIKHYTDIIKRLEFDINNNLVSDLEKARKQLLAWRTSQTEVVEKFRVFTTEILEPLKDKNKFAVYNKKTSSQNEAVKQIFDIFLPRNLKTAEAKKALAEFQQKFDQYKSNEKVILDELKVQKKKRDDLEKEIIATAAETEKLRLEYVKKHCAYNSDQSKVCRDLKSGFISFSNKETDLRVKYQDIQSLIVIITKKLTDFQSTEPEKPLAPLLGFEFNYYHTYQAGIDVLKVIPGSPAHKAGIVKGDRITRIGGFLIARDQRYVKNSVSMEEIRNHIYGRHEVVLTVNDQGRLLKFEK